MKDIRIVEFDNMLDSMQKTDSTEYAIGEFYDCLKAVKVCTYSQLIKTMEKQLAEFASQNGFCPKCVLKNGEMNNMYFETHLEQREYLGTTVYEPCCAMVCEECGYSS